MKSFSNTTQISVDCTGEAAREILKSGSKGRVRAVFSNAIYLESFDDELMWLVTDNIPMHRRAMQIPGALPRVPADSSFKVEGQHVLLGADIDLDLNPASIWVAPRPNLDKLLPYEYLPERWRIVSCLFDEFPTPTGFGCFLLELTRIAHGCPTPEALPDYGLALTHARPALNEIAQASMVNDFPRILRTGEDLIGLGEGLTPSGDDFMGGILFSSIVLMEIYSQYQGFTSSDVDLFFDNSRDQTNLISIVMLKDLAKGYDCDTLHRFMNAILTDQHLESINRLGLELVQIGHSTGWDLLTGVWTGMLLSISSRAVHSDRVPAFVSR